MKSNWLRGNSEIKNRDLINKYSYKNTEKIPKITQMTLNFNCSRNPDLKNLAKTNLALKLLTKSNCILTKAKKDSPVLGVKKNAPLGNRVTLKKSELKSFLSYLQVEVIPKMKSSEKDPLTPQFVEEKTFSMVITQENLFCFEELEQNSLVFKNLPTLNITFVLSKKIDMSEKMFILETLLLHQK